MLVAEKFVAAGLTHSFFSRSAFLNFRPAALILYLHALIVVRIPPHGSFRFGRIYTYGRGICTFLNQNFRRGMVFHAMCVITLFRIPGRSVRPFVLLCGIRSHSVQKTLKPNFTLSTFVFAVMGASGLDKLRAPMENETNFNINNLINYLKGFFFTISSRLLL